MKANCAQLKGKLARDEKRAQWRAWKEKDLERREKQWARQEEKDKEYMIARGELTVGDGGKTMPMWPFSGR